MKTWKFKLVYSNGMIIETWVEAPTEVEAAQKLFRRKSAVQRMLFVGEKGEGEISFTIKVEQVESRQLITN